MSLSIVKHFFSVLPCITLAYYSSIKKQKQKQKIPKTSANSRAKEAIPRAGRAKRPIHPLW